MSEPISDFSIEDLLISYSVVAYAVLVSLLVWQEITQWWRERKNKDARKSPCRTGQPPKAEL
jgi:hypothetical protein